MIICLKNLSEGDTNKLQPILNMKNIQNIFKLIHKSNKILIKNTYKILLNLSFGD